MATTNQHISARNDADILDRFIAAAEILGIEDASRWVQANIGQLITITVESGQTVADVHAYAREVREAYIAATPPRPGVNLSAVTDTHLATAIDAVWSAETAPESPLE
jgi:hypothetical protein